MGKKFTKFIKYIIDCILEVLYFNDDNCVICKEYSEEGLCKKCKDNIRYCNENFNLEKDGYSFVCCSSAYYSNVVKELVLNLKYKSDFRAGEILVELLLKTMREKNINADFITFVPSASKAIKKRGYNQSEFLARTLGKRLECDAYMLLKKIRETKDQIGLDNSSRWNNLEGCFSFYEAVNIKNKKIILVDDVITTGATAFCCAKELIRNGALEVFVLTVAKSRI